MYKTALIQNESEMLRYGWADIRPSLTNIDYEWVSFTIDKISELFAELPLRRYDGIVIATNACNDQNVREILQDKKNRATLHEYLEQGGGLFVSFQMRLTDHPSYRFLPDKFDVAAINRKELGPEGHLVIPTEHCNHILYRYPNSVTSNEIADQCLHNEFVKSLYRGYLKPLNEEVYEVLLVDDSYDYNRPLLMCSRSNVPGRVVVTSLPLDWQGHQRLLENVVRYVVEGQPRLAVVGKFRETEFDFQYLVSSLEVTKVPFSRYVQSNLDFSKMLLSIHDTVILDPAWTYQDIVDSDYSKHSDQFHSGIRLFFFSRTSTGDPILSRIGGLKSSQVLLPRAVTWIKSQYENGRWGGSFWHTFDVLEAFVELGIDVAEYRDEVLETIETHNIGGSYDEVIGATCALLKIYRFFMEDKNKKIQQTLSWLRNKIPQASFYEQAATIDTFNELGIPLDEQLVAEFRSKATSLIPSLNDELKLYRYAKTLLSCGYIEDAHSACLRLSDHQAEPGGWINVARTASILLLLIRVQQELKNPSRELDDMIFKGVTFIKSTYDPENNNWHNDIPSTAKTIRVLTKFEQLISYPVNELVQTFQGFHRISSEFKTLKIASSQNSKLQREKATLKQKLQKELAVRSFSTKLAVIVVVISAPILTLLLLLLFYSIQNNEFSKFWSYFTKFLVEQTVPVSTSVALIPLIILYSILRTFGFIPRLKLIPRKWEDAILQRLLGKTNRP